MKQMDDEPHDGLNNDSHPGAGPPTNNRIRKRFRLGCMITSIVGVSLLVACVSIPLIWEGVEFARQPSIGRMQITHTIDEHHGDPINVSLVGNATELLNIMKTASWDRADALSVKSDLFRGADTILERTYKNAPVSRLFLLGREEYYAFELPLESNPRHDIMCVYEKLIKPTTPVAQYG